MLFLSVLSSLLCYSCVHAVLFWVFYEMSIIPLILLLVVDSPYSERYIALWYFLGYVVLGSLPMLVCLLYISEVSGGFDIRFWVFGDSDILLLLVNWLLGVLFITKVPLIPFHVWLPIVHAEASSPVSVCLSGYIMKLGVLGVYRFCWDLLPVHFFSPCYILVCLLASLGFFCCSLRELDGKRWIALLSLGHIVIAVFCLSLGGWKIAGLSFVYCLGHGLSAAAVFVFIWLVAGLSGTRNLFLMKGALWGNYVTRVIFCFVLGTVCCMPPTIQFFSEVYLMVEVLWQNNYFLSFFLCVYLFLSGFIPILFLAFSLTRHYDLHYFFPYSFLPLCSLVFLLFWSYALFMVI